MVSRNSDAGVRDEPGILLYIFVISLSVISCGSGKSSQEETVRFWAQSSAPEIFQTASRFPGITMAAANTNTPWPRTIKETETAPDLILTEWGYDFTSMQESGVLTNFVKYRSQAGVLNALWPSLSIGKGFPPEFLPTSVHTWVIFYNKDVLAGHSLTPPETWDQWQDALSRLRASGTIPVALSSPFGWPALAWLSYIDLRLNGLAEHRKLLDGKRSFTDRSMKSVFDLLEAWRNEGVFDPESGTMNWPDALQRVRSGKAAFILLNSSAVTRISRTDAVDCIPVPAVPGQRLRGEIAAVQGFIIPGTSAVIREAVRIAGSFARDETKALTGNPYKLPAVKTQTEEGAPRITGIQKEILTKAAGVVPQLDRILGAQEAYDSNLAVAAFFAPGSMMSGALLAETLQKIRTAEAGPAR